jgi:hypothetical protein
VPALEPAPDLVERVLDVALPRQPCADGTAEAGKFDPGFRRRLRRFHDCRVVTGAGCCAEDVDDDPVEDEPVEAEPVDVEPADDEPVEVEPVVVEPVVVAGVAAFRAVELDFVRLAIDRLALFVADEAGADTAAWPFLPSAGS